MYTHKMKLLTYVLILGVFISCFGNASFARAESSKKLITEIYDLEFFYASHMFAVGTDSLKNTLADYVDFGIYAVCEDNSTCLEITPVYDYSSVNTNKEGCYEMTLTLQYDKELYQLSDEYQDTYTIPVCISDPDKFDIFPTYTSFDHTTLSYIHPFKDYTTMQISYIRSKESLTLSQLETMHWTKMASSSEANPTPDGLTLSSSFFTEDSFLYIQLENENMTSNILCFEQKNNSVSPKTIEGDRDGGDYSSEDSYVIVAPLTTPGKEETTEHKKTPKSTAPAAIVLSATPRPVAKATVAPKAKKSSAKKKASKKNTNSIIGITSSNTKSTKRKDTNAAKKETKSDTSPISYASTKTVVEQTGSNHISLSGKRLRFMAQSNPVSIPFTYENYVLEIPSELLLALNLKDDELLTVSISADSGKAVTLTIRAAGKAVTDIPGSRLTWKNENKTLTIDKTGTYKIPGSKKQTLPIKRTQIPRYLLIGTIVLVLASTGCFVYRKKERKH